MQTKLGANDRLLVLKKPFESVEVRQLALAATQKWRNARQAQQYLTELTANQKQLQALVDHTNAIIYLRDAEQRFTLVNRRFCELTGRSAEQLVGKRAMEIFPEDKYPSLLHGDQQVLQTGQAVEHEISLADTFGVTRTYAANTFALGQAVSDDREPDCRQLAVGTIANDITSRRTMEAAMRAAKEQAQRSDRAKDEFLATLSHEFRTPLNAVLGLTQLALEDLHDPESVRSDLESVMDAAHSLLSLVDNALRFVQVDSGRYLARVARFDITELLRELVAEVAPLAADNQIDVDITDAGSLGAMESDRDRVRQLLRALLSNACKFTPRGTVSITAKHQADGSDQKVIFAVRDTGIGIEPDKLDEIFGLFVQADSTTRRAFSGVGLGLALAHKLCESLHGQIAVESKVNIGSVFTVSLPRFATSADNC